MSSHAGLPDLFPGAITDVAGLKLGHFTDTRRPTGCSVVLCEQGAVAGVDVRGAAPGTRETDLLSSDNTVQQVHAVLLTGGSAFGLDAAGGVMRWLDEHGHGLAVGPARVPIVPAAVLFDLWLESPLGRPEATAPPRGADAAGVLGASNTQARIRPDATSGYAACVVASQEPPAQGSVGAGAGATLGKLFGIERAMKGGIGTAAIRVGAITVGALVAVNAIGDVIDPATGLAIAGARTPDGRGLVGSTAAFMRGELPERLQIGMATTIGIVATDAQLTKTQANKLATMAHDGLARTINPVHTLHDGDTMFALATGAAAKPGQMAVLGALAAEVTARAVLNAVRSATGLPGLPALRDLI